MEVSLQEMLEAREQRAIRQEALTRELGLPLLSFSMNIPGPIKDSPLIRRGFQAGIQALFPVLPGDKVVKQQIIREKTGCEALYAVSMDAVELKKRTVAIEDHHPLGRLFDMDVLDPEGRKLDRALVGGGSRNCIICGAPGRACASRRLHTVEQLQQKVTEILMDYFREKDREQIGIWAAASLLEEVCTTPKPGLVDLANTGSHRDMDVFTFAESAGVLEPYFLKCVGIGQTTRNQSPEETFRQLRRAGIQAEAAMYQATGGVNTHKGAVFTMGLLCGSAGRLWEPERRPSPERILREVSAMSGRILREELKSLGEDTAGARLYREQGIPGIRGEAAEGLPSVGNLALPLLQNYRARGFDRNRAGSLVLLHLIAGVTDTNMIARGGMEGARWGAAQAERLLHGTELPSSREIQELDRQFIRRNLSPGGCADLLAAAYFLSHFADEKTPDRV